MQQRERVKEIIRRLKRLYPQRGPFVIWSNPLELVVGTVLSAQCTDERVNIVTKKLFKKYRTAAAYAAADIRMLEQEIYSTGFYKAKARYLKGIGSILVAKFGGTVPDSLDALLTLPGVSHKSAHLVMAKAFGKPTGIAVDTHVLRVAPRLGLTKHTDPKKVGPDLEQFVSPKNYLDINEYFIMHGRTICKPKPMCAQCVLKDICPSAKRFLKSD